MFAVLTEPLTEAHLVSNGFIHRNGVFEHEDVVGCLYWRGSYWQWRVEAYDVGTLKIYKDLLNLLELSQGN